MPHLYAELCEGERGRESKAKVFSTTFLITEISRLPHTVSFLKYVSRQAIKKFLLIFFVAKILPEVPDVSETI